MGAKHTVTYPHIHTLVFVRHLHETERRRQIEANKQTNRSYGYCLIVMSHVHRSHAETKTAAEKKKKKIAATTAAQHVRYAQ